MEVATSSEILGRCEQYIPKADAAEMLASFLTVETKSAVASELLAVNAEAYVRGRKLALTDPLTSDHCSRVLNAQGDALRSAREAVEKAKGW